MRRWQCALHQCLCTEGATNQASLTVIFTFLKYEVEKRPKSLEVRRPDQHRCNLTVSPHAALIGTFDPRYAAGDYISVQKSLITRPCCPWEMSKLLRGEATLEKHRRSCKSCPIQALGKVSFNCFFFCLSCLSSLSCLWHFSPEVVAIFLPKWPAWKVLMVGLVRKLVIVHKQIGGCLILDNLRLTCFKEVGGCTQASWRLSAFR